MTKRVGPYLRVSTKNGQTVDNQRQAITDAIGRRRGWIIAEEFADEGISGAKGRDKRPEFDRLLKEVVRGKDRCRCRVVGRPSWPIPAGSRRLSWRAQRRWVRPLSRKAGG
jgi:DNA invertase Pin-like site-specific DNA recombinase